MIFRFVLLSDEADNFKREIEIDPDSTFLRLHDAILESVGYTKDQITSFFICDDDWRRRNEITLIDMNASFEEESYVMEDTKLDDLLGDEGQKLMFVYDNLNDRAFYMELREIITGKSLDKPVCSKSVGEPPVQVKPIEDPRPGTDDSLYGKLLYGTSEYNPDELEEGGFGGLDDDIFGNPYNEDRY